MTIKFKDEPSIIIIHESFGPYMLRPKRPIHVVIEHSPSFCMGRPGDTIFQRISITSAISDVINEVCNQCTTNATDQPAGVPIRLETMGHVAWSITKALLKKNEQKEIFQALHSVKVVDVNGRTIEVQS